MSAKSMTWLSMVALACTAPQAAELATPEAGTGAVSAPPPAKGDADRAAAGAPASAGVSPLPMFPSGWHVLVLEPLEAQLGGARFMSAPPSVELANGDRLSLWPIYGSIVWSPK